MSREFFAIEKGIEIQGENTDTGVQLLFGAGLPGGTTETDNAPQGSTYQRTDGSLHIKKTAGTGTDKWIKMANANDITSLSWRAEIIRVGTGDVAPASGGVLDLTTTPFGDDDVPLIDANDFAVDEYIVFGIGGTPKIMRVSVVAFPNITVVDPTPPDHNALADNDMMIIRNFLPDSPDAQEKQIIALYNGTNVIKLADFNFAIATGINLSASYTPGAGDPAASEVLESVLEKLDGNNDAVLTALGIAQGALHFGTFTGGLLTDNSTAKALFQQIETEIERLDGQMLQNAVTSAVVLDEFDVDDFLSGKWMITASLDSNPARRKSVIVHGQHNGHSGADAASVDDTSFGKLLIGAAFSTTITVELIGVGAAQKMQLKVAASAATSFRSKRIGFVEAGGI